MQPEIKKYNVKHPSLRKYIKFFWVLKAEHMLLNHKLIPQSNINLRFNLSETPQYLCVNGKEERLEEVFFSGLQDHFMNAYMKLNGKVDMLGVCFKPEGFYPFLKIPVSEFKNQHLGGREVGFKKAGEINNILKNITDVESKLLALERELLLLLDNRTDTPEYLSQIFNALKQVEGPIQLSEFCNLNNIGLRRLERMSNKYVGVSAKTYITLHRFQKSMNQLLYKDYRKLSDIAFSNSYFDQMHFIREFKRFAGDTPKSFVDQNNSILQIGKLR